MPDLADDPTFQAIRGWIGERLGIRFADDQIGVLHRRLAGLVGEDAHALHQLWARLRAEDGDVALRVAEVASTNHSYFFREPETFAALTSTIVPTLPVGPWRIWSAAASSGEEAYTLAMVLLGVRPFGDVRILGTDISARALERAESGRYERDVLQHVPAAYRHHFREHTATSGKATVEVSSAVRQLCTFRLLNLTQVPWPFAQRFHVIFLRNVLYYFDVDTRRRIIEACYDVAEPGAWLVFSLSEPLLNLRTRWVHAGPGLLRKERR
jgi:chemotaxis protein methyltransferase CheR